MRIRVDRRVTGVKVLMKAQAVELLVQHWTQAATPQGPGRLIFYATRGGRNDA